MGKIVNLTTVNFKISDVCEEPAILLTDLYVAILDSWNHVNKTRSPKSDSPPPFDMLRSFYFSNTLVHDYIIRKETILTYHHVSSSFFSNKDAVDDRCKYYINSIKFKIKRKRMEKLKELRDLHLYLIINSKVNGKLKC